MGDLDLNIENIYYALSFVNNSKERLSELSSVLNSINTIGVELSTAGLLDSSKLLVNEIVNGSFEDVGNRLEKTKNIIVDNDVEALLYFAFLDGEFDDDFGNFSQDKFDEYVEKKQQELYEEAVKKAEEEYYEKLRKDSNFRYETALKAILSENGFESLEEIDSQRDKLLSTIKELNKRRNDILFSDAQVTLNFLNVVNGKYMGICSSFVGIANSETLAYKYVDKYGIEYLSWTLNGVPKDYRDRVESLSYTDMCGGSVLYNEVKSGFEGNWFFTNPFNSEYKALSKQIQEQISIESVELEEINNSLNLDREELAKLDSTRQSIVESATYISEDVWKYTLNEDFDKKSSDIVSDEISSILINLKNTSIPVNFSSDSLPMFNQNHLYLNNREEEMQVVYSMIAGKEDFYFGNGEVSYINSSGQQVYLKTNDDMLSNMSLWASEMSDEQKAIFYYNWNTGGYEAAYDYLDGISDELNSEYVRNRTEEDQKYADENPGLASVTSVLLGPFEGLKSFEYSVTQLINKDKMYSSQLYSHGDTMRVQVSTNIANKPDDKYAGAKSFLYNVGMSLADNMYSIALTGGNSIASGMILGAGGFDNNMNDALSRGLSDEKAFMYSGSMALVEAATEAVSIDNLLNLKPLSNSAIKRVGDFIGASDEAITSTLKATDDVFDKLKFDKLEKINNFSDEIFNKVVLNLDDITEPKYRNLIYKGTNLLYGTVKQGSGEGMEELASSIMGEWVDKIFAGENSAFNLSVENYINYGYTEAEAIAMTQQQQIEEFAMSYLSGLTSGSISGGGKLAGSMAIGDVSSYVGNMIDKYKNPNYDVVKATINENIRKRNFEGAIDFIMNQDGKSVDERAVYASSLINVLSLKDNRMISENMQQKLTDMVQEYVKNNPDVKEIKVDVKTTETLDGFLKNVGTDYGKKVLSMYLFTNSSDFIPVEYRSMIEKLDIDSMKKYLKLDGSNLTPLSSVVGSGEINGDLKISDLLNDDSFDYYIHRSSGLNLSEKENVSSFFENGICYIKNPELGRSALKIVKDKNDLKKYAFEYFVDAQLDFKEQCEQLFNTKTGPLDRMDYAVVIKVPKNISNKDDIVQPDDTGYYSIASENIVGVLYRSNFDFNMRNEEGFNADVGYSLYVNPYLQQHVVKEDNNLAENSSQVFKTATDIALYFGDSKLYLQSLLVKKRANNEIKYSISEMQDLKKQLYNGDESAVKKVKSLLNQEELTLYEQVLSSESSSLQGKWISKLTEEEKNAISSYTVYFDSISAWEAMEYYGYDSKGNSYVSITELMRAGYEFGSENLDSALQKFGKLPSEIITYRGVGLDALTAQFGDINFDNLETLIGKVYTDKAYMSTTLLENKARAALGKSTDVILKITVPNDANYGAFIESQANLSYNQLEFLVKKNSSSIIENAFVDENGKIIVEMKLFGGDVVTNASDFVETVLIGDAVSELDSQIDEKTKFLKKYSNIDSNFDIKALQEDIINSDLSLSEIFELPYINNAFSDIDSFRKLFDGISEEDLKSMILDERNSSMLSKLIELNYDPWFYTELIEDSPSFSHSGLILQNINSNYFGSVIRTLEFGNYNFSGIIQNTVDKEFLAKLFSFFVNNNNINLLYDLSYENMLFVLSKIGYRYSFNDKYYNIYFNLRSEFGLSNDKASLLSFIRDGNNVLGSLFENKYSKLDMTKFENLMLLQNDIIDSDIPLIYFSKMSSLTSVFSDIRLFSKLFEGISDDKLKQVILNDSNLPLMRQMLSIKYDSDFYVDLLSNSKTVAQLNVILANISNIYSVDVIAKLSEKRYFNDFVNMMNDDLLKKIFSRCDVEKIVIKLSDDNLDRIIKLNVFDSSSSPYLKNYLKYKDLEVGFLLDVADAYNTANQQEKEFLINFLSSKLSLSSKYTLYSKFGIKEFYDEKYVSAMEYVNGEMLDRIKKSFGTYVSDLKISELPSITHFMSDSEFCAKYGKNTNAMAMNGNDGSYMNLKYEFYKLKSNSVHESLHALARWGGGTGFIQYTYSDKLYNGFGEVATEYLTELAMEDAYPTVIDGQIYCGYQNAVLRLKKMVDAGILDVEKIKQGYFDNNISYIKTAISKLSDDKTFDKMMECFDIAISNDYDKRYAALLQLDKIITDLCMKKGNLKFMFWRR